MSWTIQCKRAGGSPYVVARSETVRDCALNGSIDLSKCRGCNQYLGEQKGN